MNVGGACFTGVMPATPIDTYPVEQADAAAGASLSLSQVVSLIEQMEYRQRALDAVRLDLMCAAMEMATGSSSARTNDLAYRSLRAELATTLGTSERAAESQMDAAWSLRRDYETTHETLAVGEISAAHARVITDAGRCIGAGGSVDVVARRAAYESEVLQHARRESVNRLRPIARRIAERFAVEPLDERHREEVRRRHVIVREREDGMSDLLAYLPTVEAYAIHDRLTRIARHVERVQVAEKNETARTGADDALGGATRQGAEPPARRTRDEIRADAFSQLLLASDPMELGTGSVTEAMRARVQVVVPVEALDAGHERIAVAELTGAGPIPCESARHLAGSAHAWERVTVDAHSGSVIAVDRYRPSEAMRRHLTARDQHCRFPGCRVPVSRCDLDHTIDAALGGATSTDNLAHLCRGHHVLKHNSEWQVRQRGDGDLLWTSPSGIRVLDRPPSRVRFARSKGDQPAERDDIPLSTPTPGAVSHAQGHGPPPGDEQRHPF